MVPRAKAPVAVQSRGKQVCTCFNVTDEAIAAPIRQAAAAPKTHGWRPAGAQLKCGTNCGSCVPELKRMVRTVIPLKQAA